MPRPSRHRFLRHLCLVAPLRNVHNRNDSFAAAHATNDSIHTRLGARDQRGTACGQSVMGGRPFRADRHTQIVHGWF
jgi:hypothetical protein